MDDGLLVNTDVVLNSKYLKNLLDDAGFGIGIYDINGIIIYYNKKALKHIGLSETQLIGRSIKDIYQGEKGEEYFHRILEVVTKKNTFEFVDPVELPMGLKWFLSAYSPIYNNEHEIVAVQIITTEITENEKIRKIMQENENKFRVLFNSSSDAIFIHSMPDMSIVDVNDETCRRFGYSKEEIKQLTIDELSKTPIFSATSEESQKKYLRIMQGETVLEEWLSIIKNGNTIWHELTAKLVQIDGENRLLVQARDITKRKKSEEALEHLSRFPSENPNPVLRISKDGKLLYSNKAGYSLTQKYDIDVGDYVPDTFKDLIKNVYDSKKNTIWELENNGKIFLYTLSPIIESGYVNVYGTDITSKKRAEDNADSTISFLDSVIDQSIFSMWISDANGLVIKTNKALCDALNLSSADIIGKYNVFNDENLKEQGVLPQIDAVYNEKKPARFSIPWNANKAGDVNFKGGRNLWIDVTLFPIVNKKGELTNAVCQWIDITKQKIQQDALEKRTKELERSWEEYKELINGMNDSAWVIDFNGKFIEVNDACSKKLGYTRDELLSMGPTDIDPTLKPEEIKNLIDEMKIDKIQVFETNHQTKDGKNIPVEISSSLVQYKGKTAVLSIARDITDRKKAELALIQERDSAKRYFNLAGTILISMNPDGTITSLNKKGYEILGYDEGALIGKNWFETCLAQEYQNEVSDVFQKLIQGEKTSVEHYENPVIRKDGTQRSISWHNTLLKDETGTITGLLCSGEDITEKKKMKQTLERIFEISSDLICEADINTATFTRVNPAFTKILGYSQEELLSESFLDLIHPEDKEETIRVIEEQLQRGEKVLSFVNRYRCKNGTYIWLDWNSNPILEEGFTYAIARDITDKKKIEEQLTESEKKFRLLAENSADIIYKMELDSEQYTYVSPSVQKIFGYTPEEALQLKLTDMLTQESYEKQLESLKKDLANPEYESGTLQLDAKHKDGHIFPIEIHANIVFDKQNRPVEIIGIARDITERKKMEEQLKESEEKYRTYINNAPDGIFVVDKTGKYLEVNEAATETTGYSKKELLNMTISDMIPLEGRERGLKHFETLLERGHSTGETMYVHKDGSLRWWTISSVKLSDNRFLGFTQDITEKKQAEDELLNMHNSLKDRIKELKCLLGLSKLIENRSMKTEVFLKQAVDLIPFAWQYPEITCARIKMKDESYTTERFQETSWNQVADIFLGDKKIGCVEVYYLEEKPTSDEGPFLNEERELINSFAEHISQYIQRKQSEEELKTLNRDLEQKIEERTQMIQQLLKQKDEFINQLGHDLKNPLGPLINILPIIEKHEQDPKNKEMLEVVNRNVRYMKDLVTKTIQLAQLQSPNTKLNIESFNLDEEIHDILETNKMMFEENHIEIQTQLENNIQLHADKLKIHEVFNNLLNNAVKYTEEEGCITIRESIHNNEILVSIQDNGRGMSPDQLTKIFDEFYKADSSRHDFESSGLGLPICKRIIEMHGGRVWAESKGVGEGSTFYFTLPLK